MGVTYTKEQQQVIDLRGRNILVSAAAGSGKTAVLVERIIKRLTKDENPINVDELLIVTYTEAAASEMKERIHGAIEKALEEEPENEHLQHQATLIHQARITTIHRFCLSVIREHFHRIQLDPGFRIGEEAELKLIKREAVEETLEQAYVEKTSEFIEFVESFATGKDDRKLEDMILQLFEFSRSYPNPREWLESCVKQYDVKSPQELEEKSFVKALLQEAKWYVEDMIALAKFGISICEEEGGPEPYADTLRNDIMLLEELAETDSLERLQYQLKGLKWSTLARVSKKDAYEESIEQVKEIREEVKSTVKMLTEKYCFATIKEMQEDMCAVKKHMEILMQLVFAFEEIFVEKKRSRNLIDFSDMEQFALQILTTEEDGAFVPTQVAKEYQEQFEEVMIDEYQDSNYVQEAILTSVSKVSQGIYNVFMVGDVKQSIYRFRLSRPELFMEKFNTYSLEESQTQRIDLHKNFRSRREVLDSTNYVFEQIMTKKLGGIAYDEKAALNVGASYEEMPGNETEVLMIETPDAKVDERMELEAIAVAQRIKKLKEEQKVLDKKTGEYRPVSYKDIVILMRSLKGWSDVFAKVLKDEGIPTYSASREGYFATQEIQLLMNYLRVLDNPMQDIPFTAVLSGMFAEVTSNEMAQLRSAHPEGCMYESVLFYLESGENERLKQKLDTFLETLNSFRTRVPYTAIHVLLEQILEETGYGNYIAALPGGEQRSANVEMFREKAVAFEGTSYKGLFNFVRYMEQLQKYNVDYGEANLMEEDADVVTLMSIHKSKGLEFPVVFVAGLGKSFNMQDVKSEMVIHPELGIGIDRVDTKHRVKTPTLLKKVIQQNSQLESIAEELRVLYVAMTRAKEKLIMTGTATDFEKMMRSYSSLENRKEKTLPYHLLAGALKYFDWVLPALYRKKAWDDVPMVLINVTKESLFRETMEEAILSQFTKDALHHWNTELVYNEEAREQIETQFVYEYPHIHTQKMKQKLSVSELKKKIYLEEAELEEETVYPFLPKFLQEEESLSGASRGTAYHKVLELLDFSKTYDENSLEAVINQKQQGGFLSKEVAEAVRRHDILRFLHSDLGKRMQEAARRGMLYAEQPFVLGVPANTVYPDVEDETLLVQGIIDAYFEEDGEIVVLDYKTDRVHAESELLQKYRAQLAYYGEALERLTGKTVKEKLIYSFTLRKVIEVCP